jgi:type II secretory pathway pseudopilin PulG
MSAIAIVLIVLGVVIVIVLIGGLVAVRSRARAEAPVFEERVAAADRALEEARAADKGWDRPVLEEAARKAVAEARPGWSIERLHLVLVDDRPGISEDRCQFVAVGEDEEVRVALARRDQGWVAERIE